MKKGLFGMFPDVSGLANQMSEKFDQMMGVLQEMLQVQRDMLAELRTQRGAPQ